MYLDPSSINYNFEFKQKQVESGQKKAITVIRPYKAVQIENLDFYLAPKCATNTIRYMSYLYNGGEESVSDNRDDTYDKLKMIGTNVTYDNERKDSIKICVKRDPIDRFISSLVWYNRKRNLNESIKNVIESVPDDIHFWPQTCFYGDPKKYDHIITMDKIISLINTLLGSDYSEVNKGQNPGERPTLTSIQLSAVKEMYRADYENGYC